MANERMSPTQEGIHPVRKLRGKIVDVDTRTHTVKVLTDDGRSYSDCQVTSPYYHYMGEGVVMLPDLDARCMLEISSDDTPPQVTGFLDIPSQSTTSELEGGSGLVESDAEEEETSISYSGAKPAMLPGDWGVIGRDGNFLFIRRGGVFHEGASAFCQRVYIPIRNVIRDFAENYELSTTGIDLMLRSERSEDSDDSSAGCTFSAVVNRHLEDEKASVLFSMGDLTSDKLVRLVVAPEGVDRSQRTWEDDLASVEIDDAGSWTLTGNDLDIDVKGDCTTNASGNLVSSALGTHKLTCRDSLESCLGTKKIVAGFIALVGKVSFGSGGKPLAGNAQALQSWLATHRHDPVTGQPVPPPPMIVMPDLLG